MAHVYFVIYYLYFIDRFIESHDPLLALELQNTNKIEIAVRDAFVNFYLVAYAMVTALELVKVQDNIGQISKVAEGVLGEVGTLFIFIIGWVLAFSMLHRVIGNNIDPKGTKYPYLNNEFSKYFLHTWAMSTGGGQNPNYSVWFSFQDYDTNNDKYLIDDSRPAALFMVFANWMTHIGNQLFVKTILLSFLIAIVKGSYNKLINQEVKLSYASKAIMNNKTSNFLKTFGLLQETDMITISADYEVKTAASDTSKLKNEVLKIEERIGTVNSQLTLLSQK